MNGRVLKWRDGTQAAMILEELGVFHAAARHQEEVKWKANRIQQMLLKVPVRFQGKKFEDYEVYSPDQSRVKRIVERFTATFADQVQDGAGLIMMGSPGTGKTLLSLIMYQELVKKHLNIRYESSLYFLKNHQEKYYESHTAYQTLLDSYQHTPLLILDEITESVTKDGRLSEWERRLLFLLIDVRYQLNLSTIVITNRGQSELINSLGRPAFDRLSENGITLLFNWDSYCQNKE